MNPTIADNPYNPPLSALQDSPSEQLPSIEEALTRGYNFGIDSLINQSWQHVKGSKGIFIGGILLIFAVACALQFGLQISLKLTGLSDTHEFYSKAFDQLVNLVTAPLTAGMVMLGIQCAAGRPIAFNDLFKYLPQALPIIVATLLMSVMIFIGYLLLVIPGIYLSIAYLLTIPLVVERGLSPWQAMEASRKAISQHWFKVCGLFLTLGLMLLVSAIPLGIGLIWTLPLAIICTGMLYRCIFSLRPTTD